MTPFSRLRRLSGGRLGNVQPPALRSQTRRLKRNCQSHCEPLLFREADAAREVELGVSRRLSQGGRGARVAAWSSFAIVACGERRPSRTKPPPPHQNHPTAITTTSLQPLWLSTPSSLTCYPNFLWTGEQEDNDWHSSKQWAAAGKEEQRHQINQHKSNGSI